MVPLPAAGSPSSAQAASTAWYLSGSRGRPNRTFSRTEPGAMAGERELIYSKGAGP